MGNNIAVNTTYVQNNISGGSTNGAVNNRSAQDPSIKAKIPIALFGTRYTRSGKTIESNDITADQTISAAAASTLRILTSANQTCLSSPPDHNFAKIFNGLKKLGGDPTIDVSDLGAYQGSVASLTGVNALTMVKYNSAVFAVAPETLKLRDNVSAKHVYLALKKAYMSRDSQPSPIDKSVIAEHLAYYGSDLCLEPGELDCCGIIGGQVLSDSVMGDGNMSDPIDRSTVAKVLPRYPFGATDMHSPAWCQDKFNERYVATLGAFEIYDYLTLPMGAVLEQQMAGLLDAIRTRSISDRGMVWMGPHGKALGIGWKLVGSSTLDTNVLLYNGVNYLDYPVPQYLSIENWAPWDQLKPRRPFPMTGRYYTYEDRVFPVRFGFKELRPGMACIQDFRLTMKGMITDFSHLPVIPPQPVLYVYYKVDGVISFDKYELSKIRDVMVVTGFGENELLAATPIATITWSFNFTVRLDGSKWDPNEVPPESVTDQVSPTPILISHAPLICPFFAIDNGSIDKWNTMIWGISAKFELLDCQFVPKSDFFLAGRIFGPENELGDHDTSYSMNSDSVATYAFNVINAEQQYLSNGGKVDADEYAEIMTRVAWKQSSFMDRPDCIGALIYILSLRLTPLLSRVARLHVEMNRADKLKFLVLLEVMLSNDLKMGASYKILSLNEKLTIVDRLALDLCDPQNVFTWSPSLGPANPSAWSMLTKFWVMNLLIHQAWMARCGRNPALVLPNAKCMKDSLDSIVDMFIPVDFNQNFIVLTPPNAL